MKNITAILLTSILYFGIAAAQTEMYQWKMYTAFDIPKQIEEGRSNVYFLADGFLYSYGKEDNEVKEITRDNYLSDNDIALIKYNYEKNILVIAYKNSNIDIFANGRTYNIPYIKEASITSSKAINNINFNNAGNEIYISADFGIIIINSSKYEIKTTFEFGEKVNDATFFNDKYYLLDKNGALLSCAEKDIPYKYDSWQLESDITGHIIVNCNDALWIMTNNNIFKYTQEKKSVSVASGVFSSLNKTPGGDVYAYGANTITVFNADATIKDKIPLSQYIDFTPTYISCNNNTGTYWTINTKGISSYRRSPDNLTITANVPIQDKIAVALPYSLSISENTLYCIPTGINIDNEAFNIAPHSNISCLYNYQWENIFGNDIPTFKSPSYINKFALPSQVAIHPDNDRLIYVGTWFDGLYRIKDGKYDAAWNYIMPTDNPSPISGPDNNWANLIGALSFDTDRNLWMTNFSPDQGLLVLKPNGEFVSFQIESLKSNKYMNSILQPKQSATKWITSTKDNSFVFALNINGTLDNQKDDTFRMFTSFVDQDAKTIDGTTFFCAVEDLDGKIWIGTDRGPIILNNPDNFMKSTFACYRVKIPRNDGTNNADLLLDDEVIRDIEVDGANCKWIGTYGSGAYLISADGLSTLYHFTTKNSLIPSDIIYDIAINQQTGEVFFATSKGLASFRAEAAEAKEDYSNVYAFPNPVSPEFSGVITITGLEANSLVKITDTVGNLIYQNYSRGGQIVWSGNLDNGSRVKSGVYYVWMSSNDGKEGLVSKIVFVN